MIIRLQGTTPAGIDIDVSLTGIGPRFKTDQMLDDGTVAQCEYVVSDNGNGYKVSYSLSVRVKVAMQPGPNASFQYQDVSTSGTVLCVESRPLVLARNGSKPLQLTITKDSANGEPVEPAVRSKTE